MITAPTPSYDLSKHYLYGKAKQAEEVASTLEPVSINELRRQSPSTLPEATQAEQWDALLSIPTLKDTDILWHGYVKESGRVCHRGRFATVAAMRLAGPPAKLPLGAEQCWTSGFTFLPGSYSRCKANVVGPWCQIFEADGMSKEAQIARALWWRDTYGLRLRYALDAAGASIHFAFDPPKIGSEFSDEVFKAIATGASWLQGKTKEESPGMGFDRALFSGSQPCRLPGAVRPPDPVKGRIGGLQSFLYLDLNH